MRGLASRLRTSSVPFGPHRLLRRFRSLGRRALFGCRLALAGKRRRRHRRAPFSPQRSRDRARTLRGGLGVRVRPSRFQRALRSAPRLLGRLALAGRRQLDAGAPRLRQAASRCAIPARRTRPGPWKSGRRLGPLDRNPPTRMCPPPSTTEIRRGRWLPVRRLLQCQGSLQQEPP